MMKVIKGLAVLCPTSDYTEDRLIARGMKSGHNYFPIMAQMRSFKKEKEKKKAP